MPGIVTDTHAIVWYLLDDPKLSGPARTAIDAAVAAGERVYVSAITLVELTYLVEKGRLPATVSEKLQAELADPETALTVVPLDTLVCQALTRVARSEVPDMPDRIIAATAVHLGLPLISRDGKIRASNVPTIW